MPTNKSSSALFAIYKGSSTVTKAYLGTDQIYPNVAPTYSVDFMLAGSGGWSGWGGGGAGEVLQTTTYGGTESAATFDSGTTYTITIGAAGSGIRGTSGASNGGDSTITGTGLTTLTAKGGGQGGEGEGQPVNQTGYNGGSGGGGGLVSSNIVTTFQGGAGNLGGNGGAGRYAGTPIACGGGGGAANNGASYPNSRGGNGATTTIISTTQASAQSVGEVNQQFVYFCGGGGGGSRNYGDISRGGLGGGGDGEQLDGINPQSNGVVNTGGGCGGLASSSVTTFGGSGCVILRMATSDYSGTTTGSPTVLTSGSDTILIYKGTGTYTA